MELYQKIFDCYSEGFATIQAQKQKKIGHIAITSPIDFEIIVYYNEAFKTKIPISKNIRWEFDNPLIQIYQIDFDLKDLLENEQVVFDYTIV